MFTDWDPQYLWKIAYKRHIIVERTVKTHPLDTKFIVNSFQNLQRICPQLPIQNCHFFSYFFTGAFRAIFISIQFPPVILLSLPTLTEVGILRFSDFPM